MLHMSLVQTERNDQEDVLRHGCDGENPLCLLAVEERQWLMIDIFKTKSKGDGGLPATPHASGL